MITNKQELEGVIKEIQSEQTGYAEKLEAQRADIAKAKEELTAEQKAWAEKMEGKLIELKQNTGTREYRFNNSDLVAKNKLFRPNLTEEQGEAIAKDILRTLHGKALTEGNTGAYAVPVEYSNVLLGLAELSSVALQECNVVRVGVNSFKVPIKYTRNTADAQAFGTANTAASSAFAQATFTIDKRIGNYETINNDLLMDSMFDVVGYVNDLIAEAIGQNIDDEVFNTGTEFTTSIGDCTNSVTASGVANIASAVTLANLTEMLTTIEMERLVSPRIKWYMNRTTYRSILRLAGTTNDHPIFMPMPISMAPGRDLLGYPIVVVPAMDDTPANGEPRMVIGDCSQYMIALNGDLKLEVNPYVLMKESQTQFIGYMRADGNIISHNAFCLLKRAD